MSAAQVARLGRQPQSFNAMIVRLVQALTEPALAVDYRGRIVACSDSAVPFAGGRNGQRLRTAVERAAQDALRNWRSGLPWSDDFEPTGVPAIRSRVLIAACDLVPAPGVVVLLSIDAPDAAQNAAAVARLRYGLTKQECRVALLLAEGLRNTEVAERLRISNHTARHHTERVLAKLGLRSRSQVYRALNTSARREQSVK